MAGVNHNSSRVGAVSGEMGKLRIWIEWVIPRPLGEAQKKSRDLTEEQSEKFAKILEGLTGEVQGLGKRVIAELKSLQEVLQDAMVEGPAT